MADAEQAASTEAVLTEAVAEGIDAAASVVESPAVAATTGPPTDNNVVKNGAKESNSVGETPAKKPRIDLQSLPTRQYLDQTVVPILLQALSTLAKERPPDPIEYLATYLLKNKSQFDPSSQNTSSEK